MNNPILDLVRHHEVIGPKSCVAWGIEFILKWHKRPVDDYSIQRAHPEGLGFDPWAIKILQEERITVTPKWATFETEFTALCLEELNKGFPPIFSFRSGYQFDFAAPTAGGRWFLHCFCAVSEGSNLGFLTRMEGISAPVFLTLQELRAFHTKSEKLDPYPAIHCLLHRATE